MKLISTIVAFIAVIATIASASAFSLTYSAVTSSSGSGYGSMRVSEAGVGSYGASVTPDGTIYGGWNVGRSSGSMVSDSEGMRSISISSPDLSGTWNRGFDGPNYGGFAVGNARFQGSMYNAVNMYGNAWGGQAVYMSPYGGSWGNRYGYY